MGRLKSFIARLRVALFGRRVIGAQKVQLVGIIDNSDARLALRQMKYSELIQIKTIIDQEMLRRGVCEPYF